MKKLSLEECYVNFSGSGKLNAKYWIFGIEPGGKLEEDENLLPSIISGKDAFLEYSNNFNDSYKGQGFNKKLSSIVKILDPNSLDESKKEFAFHKSNIVFRSNLYLLKFANMQKETFKQNINFYKKYFDINENVNDRNDIYGEKYIKKRYENVFKSYLDTCETKTIILFGISEEDNFKLLLGLEGNFANTDIHWGNTYLRLLSMCENRIRVFSFPLSPRISYSNQCLQNIF